MMGALIVLGGVVGLLAGAIVGCAVALVRANERTAVLAGNLAETLRASRADMQVFAIKADNRKIAREAVRAGRGPALRAAADLVTSLDPPPSRRPANGREAPFDPDDAQLELARLHEPGWTPHPPAGADD